MESKYFLEISILNISFRLFIYDCSQTMDIINRKNRIVKQLNSSIHSILFVHLDVEKICFIFFI
jgi:hypothetical protein